MLEGAGMNTAPIYNGFGDYGLREQVWHLGYCRKAGETWLGSSLSTVWLDLHVSQAASTY